MSRLSTLNSWKEIAEYLGRSVRTVQRWESTLALPVRHRPGRRTSVFAIDAELDTWLQSRSRFRSSHEGARHIAYDAVFDRAPVPLAVVTEAREWVDANAAACQLLGTTRQELLGSTVDDFASPDDAGRIRAAWDAVVHHGRPAESIVLARPTMGAIEINSQAIAAVGSGLHVVTLRRTSAAASTARRVIA
jgi:PAS domain-containing protein